MTKIKAILIDDEQSTLRGLEKKINENYPEIEILGTYQKPEDGIAALSNGECNLLFLDIEMPRMTGFELLGKLDKVNFEIIFVTAYNDYALDAFKHSAIDYVLKPIDTDDLVVAIEKAIKSIEQEEKSLYNAKLVKILSDTIRTTGKVVVPTSKGITFFPEMEVKHFEGFDGYTKINLINDVVVLSSYNLGKFEKSLSNTFFKCHKSHIINLKLVRGIENEGYLVLDHDYRVPISRANKKVFLELFS